MSSSASLLPAVRSASSKSDRTYEICVYKLTKVCLGPVNKTEPAGGYSRGGRDTSYNMFILHMVRAGNNVLHGKHIAAPLLVTVCVI